MRTSDTEQLEFRVPIRALTRWLAEKLFVVLSLERIDISHLQDFPVSVYFDFNIRVCFQYSFSVKNAHHPRSPCVCLTKI